MKLDWRLAMLILSLLLLAGACGPAAAGEKYALLCGCARYDKVGNTGPADLDTTVYDVLALYDLLTTRFAFKPENIRVLLSPPDLWPRKPAPAGPATADNIAENFARWFAKAGPDDLILFAYSGHGTFLHHTAGAAPVHEEALLASDYMTKGWVLTFSQIRWLHFRLHDGQSVFLIDACHSGGSSLAPADILSPYGPPPPVRFTSTSPDTKPVATPALAAAPPPAPNDRDKAAVKMSKADRETIRRRTTTITACQSWEVASAMGPELTVQDKPHNTGVLTGYVVRAVAEGAQNQSWEDVGRTARFLSVLNCVAQTVGVSGQGLAAQPFTHPATPPTPPLYYVALPRDRDLLVPRDPFLGPGSLAGVFKDATPAGAPADPNAKLEDGPASDLARLVCKVAAEGPRAVVLQTQQIALPPLGIWTEVADPLGKQDPDATRTLQAQMAKVPYADLRPKVYDDKVDYRLWVSMEDEENTFPFARARSAEFPCFQVHGKPAPRSLDQSAAWLRGMAHYLRAVQGAAWARNHAAAFRVWVTPDRERPLYRPGEATTMKLEANAPCWVVVVVADSSGHLMVVPDPAGGKLEPGAPRNLSFTLDASGPAHDMHLAIVKAFALTRKPDGTALKHLASDEARADPAKAMLALLSDVLGAQTPGAIPCEGWADNEVFLAEWDRMPLAGPLEF
jgi:hypothetical protein